MSKWLRYEKAKTSAVYTALAAEAADALTTVGSFNKDAVLKKTGLDVFDDGSIRWDYVRRMIEEEYNTELYPVASVFFKRGGTALAKTFPERFIATGHGKKTAGFVIASAENAHFVVRRLEIRRAIKEGTSEAYDRTLLIGKKVGALVNGEITPSAGTDLETR